MNVVDANVLLYATNADSDRHDVSRGWIDWALSGNAAVGFAWIALTAFVRISTKANIFPSPLTPDEAVDRVEAWLSSPSAVTVEPTARHLGIVRELLAPLGTGGNLFDDAHLAALAVEHRGRVVSFDSDLGRFDGVDRVEPALS